MPWRTPMLLLAAGGGCAVIVLGCASAPSDADISAKVATIMKASFKARGQAKLERLDQDETQRACSAYANKAPPKDEAQMIEKLNLATIKWPSDATFLGDWKNGEKIAQEGRGMQYSDDPQGPVGANCYACHQIAAQEVAYGTIGPSLYQFGKLHGYGVDVQKYAYGKVFNPEAYAACTNMPRFGHNGILTEEQIKDVVALLMDPDSPVNK
jgi:sulfur-oxidizing protein SoxX